MSQGRFHLVGLDESGGKHEGVKGDIRLVCQIDGGGKLAIWGSIRNTRNIDLVMGASFPCVISCLWREPSSWARERYGHIHWVQENANLEVISQYFEKKQGIEGATTPYSKSGSNAASSEKEVKPDRLSQADRIRQYTFQHYIQPAQKAGQEKLLIRAGNISRELDLNNRVPAIYSALQTRKFFDLAGVELLERTGPPESTRTEFHYAICEIQTHQAKTLSQTVSRELKKNNQIHCVYSKPPNKNQEDTLPEIGTYWHGHPLDSLERACLISMMEQGHSVTLFCHEKVEGVPEGVEIRDAREVTGDRPLLFFENSKRRGVDKSPALFTDLFRYHMISKLGMIWLDLDAFLLKPLRLPKDGYIFAWDRKTIAGGVLALPQYSPSLEDLISFCEDEYPVPTFFSWISDRKAKLYFMKAIGKPVHVSCQKWGVWGPRALTWFLTKNQEDCHALETKLLYPIDWRDLSPFFLQSNEVKESYLKDAISVHLFGSRMRENLRKVGEIPKGSYLQELINIGEQ